MELLGTMDNYPVKILYNTNGFEFLNIGVQVGLVVFEWDQLSSLQQDQILKQLKNNLPRTEENYN